jgi:predicted phage terminase large subunit-like protein
MPKQTAAHKELEAQLDQIMPADPDTRPGVDGIHFSDDEIQNLLKNIDTPGYYDDHELTEVHRLVDELEARQQVERVKTDLIEFCKYMQSDYIVGRHHRILADLLMDIAFGREDRICVNIPPRHGKTQLDSIYFPAWFLGHFPDKKVMMVSHTTDLAVDFGRKVRNLIASDRYKAIFPSTALSADSKSAGRWNTNHGGEYFACGIGSSIAGRGADLLLIDDPHSEQDVLNGNFEVFERAYQWFTFGARTRLMPGGRVAIIQTRWHMDDLSGRVQRDMVQNPETDQYHVVEFPAILTLPVKDDEGNETGEEVEKPLWPEFFDLKALKRIKAGMPVFQWNSQYQQNPTAEEGAIIKREWWNSWGEEKAPNCEYVIMSLDAAAERHNRADYTSISTWGVFFNENTDAYNIILLNAVKDRYEFPELKKKSMQQYEEWEPDSFIVEKKSAGTALYQELRRIGIPVREYTPSRGTTNNPNTKHARLNSVADIVASGLCWVPQTRWAEDLVEEIAAFPYGSNDDQVDTTIMTLMRFRQGGFIRLPTDESDEIQYFKGYRGRRYY